MNTRWIVPLVSLLVVGCGGGDTGGMTVDGTVAVTVHQAGQSDGNTGFNFRGTYTVDTPPNAGHGFDGTCVHTGDQYTFTLSREAALPTGLDSVTVTTNTGTSPQVSLSIGTSTFAAGGTCLGTATPQGASDLQLTIQCSGLVSGSDPRTVDMNLTLTVTGCTG